MNNAVYSHWGCNLVINLQRVCNHVITWHNCTPRRIDGFINFWSDWQPEVYLTQNIFKFAFEKSTPPQIRQLILYYYSYKEQADRFVRELTFAKRPSKHCV